MGAKPRQGHGDLAYFDGISNKNCEHKWQREKERERGRERKSERETEKEKKSWRLSANKSEKSRQLRQDEGGGGGVTKWEKRIS